MTNKVMIVVEGDLYGKLLAKAFEERGYGVCAILSKGEDAIEIALQEKPKAILMDFLLQGDLTGVETAHIIQADHKTPIVFLKNRLANDRLFMIEGEGVQTLITKRKAPAEIVTAVDKAVRLN